MKVNGKECSAMILILLRDGTSTEIPDAFDVLRRTAPTYEVDVSASRVYVDMSEIETQLA